MYTYTDCYKHNDTYTTFVPRIYYPHTRGCTSVRGIPFRRLLLSERTLLRPLPNGTVIHHRLYGNGILQSTDLYGTMTIAFASKTARFVFPDAFKQGYLTRLFETTV